MAVQDFPNSPHPVLSPVTDPADPQQFRAALGLFATGVTIVTAIATDGRPVGLTANSFNSVSLAPPLVLWSLSRGAASMAVFSTAAHYAIHILAAEQMALAQRFATRGADRFAGLAWHPGAGGVPLLEGCAAVFECAQRSQHEEGDHVIFVGEVQRCTRREEAQPLIYHGGRYYTELPLG
ncbi:flavin reductase family protein [Roseateles sp. BYS180W]|uniref:Flavin reductase family protein n=1 Tax=Roseateles rivi TaxID=3299028 RepID=A0ABW7FTG2_9BURK